jgi:hypothetical protein
MEKGDLSSWAVPRLIVILEGVLVDVVDLTGKGRFGRTKVTGTHWAWLDLPLKMMVSTKRRYEDVAIDVVTFLNQEAADAAADFLARYGIEMNEVYYTPFEEWCWALQFRPEIVTIYDSDQERLQHYGQKGFAVVKGGTW